MANDNTNLHSAKGVKDDEFYTTFETIAEELRHYTKHFNGKTILCNCDDPIESNFYKYFLLNFKRLKLRRLNLGQLWAYCKLCDPAEAFLLSSLGMGSLNKILNNLGRLDLLDFGDGRRIKKMQVGKWNITSNMIDSKTLVPKL